MITDSPLVHCLYYGYEILYDNVIYDNSLTVPQLWMSETAYWCNKLSPLMQKWTTQFLMVTLGQWVICETSTIIGWMLIIRSNKVAKIVQVILIHSTGIYFNNLIFFMWQFWYFNSKTNTLHFIALIKALTLNLWTCIAMARTIHFCAPITLISKTKYIFH